MLVVANRPPRRGASVVEAAFVLPVALFFILALVIGAMGVFRFQEVAHLAREGARWASVHGSDYHTETGNAAASAADVYNNAIRPNALSMDPASLSYSVSWSPGNQPPNGVVSVTVSYSWIPELYLIGPITLSSTSQMAMSY